MKFPGYEKLVPAFSQTMLVVALLTAGQPVLADAEADYQEGLTAYRATDLVGSMTPLKRAADAGHARAQALYGTILDSAEFDDEAVIYLRKSAEQNDPEGQFALAKMYMTGEGVAVDNSEANRLIRAAAAQGHDRAVIALALAYVARDARLGAETQTDPEAAELLVKAAELGEVSAIDALAKAYRDGGFGLEPNAEKAAEWAAKLATLHGTGTKSGGRK